MAALLGFIGAEEEDDVVPGGSVGESEQVREHPTKEDEAMLEDKTPGPELTRVTSAA